MPGWLIYAPVSLPLLFGTADGMRNGMYCRKLSAGLCEVVEDFGLVTFVPLAVQVGDCTSSTTLNGHGG
jgi:hypothetical protein